MNLRMTSICEVSCCTCEAGPLDALVTCPAQDLCEPHAVARNRLDLKTAAFVLHPLRNQAMENLPNGHLMTDLQHFWNSPQAQLLFQQITTQRNLETHQMSPCLPQRHYIPIPPPSPLPHNYPPPPYHHLHIHDTWILTT